MRSLLLLALFAVPFASFAKGGGPMFIENVGQLTDQHHRPRTDIDFALQCGNMNAFIEAGAIHYQFVKGAPHEVNSPQDVKDIPLTPFARAQSLGTKGESPLLNIHRIDVELLGANKNVRPVKEGRLQYYERYYTPQFGEDGGTAHAYSRIVYKDIYPHIDWVIYINGEQVEYDFIVKDGGKPSDIQLKYGGATSLAVNPSDDLVVASSLGTITEHAPTSYQADGKQVRTSFVVKGDVVSFSVAPYSGVLLIDPYLEWATYYGGAGDETGLDITEDFSGNVYMCGKTKSMSYVSTIGAYDEAYSDSSDAYIVKFDSNGVRLWATYYGGSGFDEFSSIAYDLHGCIFSSGTTDNNSGIATIGSDQPNFNGPYAADVYVGGDAFLVKFDSTGSRLWGTYIGGTGIDQPAQIVCDNSGDIYMSGMAASNTNIATIGTSQTIYGGNADAFLLKYSGAGAKQWGTYLGGGTHEGCFDLAISNNTLYICGETSSSTNIATSGTYQSIQPTVNCGYVAAFTTNGIRIWGTYFGGSSTNTSISTDVWSVCCNSNNDVFILGRTTDTAGIATTGCYQSQYGGNGYYNYGDAVIARFDNTGNRIWSTYVGGSGSDIGGKIICNFGSELYLVGATTSLNNIAVNAFQGNYGGVGQYGASGWMAKFSDLGSCVWSTYLGGGNQIQFLTDLMVSQNHENIYVCGEGIFPTTTGSHQQFNSGLDDAYIAKFKDFPTDIQPVSSLPHSLNIYPNPNTGAFTITAKNIKAQGSATVMVMDILGKQVYSNEVSLSNGAIETEVRLGQSVPAGLYILKLHTGVGEESVRFVKE